MSGALAKPCDLLILDEPTNHLDHNAKEDLINALKKYQGTVIFASMNAAMINRITARHKNIKDSFILF